MRLLTEPEIRRLVSLDRDVVETVRGALTALSVGGIEMPPVLSLHLPHCRGEVDVKTAFVPGLPRLAIKISAGFFNNPALGLPSLTGLMAVLDARTGLPTALLLDNGYLTDVRTAAAGAVAADVLARGDARIAAVLGTGMQAWMQIAALQLIRPLEEVRVWGRRPNATAALVDRIKHELCIAAVTVEDPRRAVQGANIIVTATPSDTPLLRWEWLTPGQHITAMGSDAPYKNELEPAIVARADRYVPDRLSQCAALGELRVAIAAGLVLPDRDFPELGQVARGAAPGRADRAEITVCDLTGLGVQDTAIANLAVLRAEQAGSGTLIDTAG